MIRSRTTKEVRRHDIFKLSIVLLLLVLIFLMLLRENDPSFVTTTEEKAISSEVSEPGASDESETSTAAEEAYPADSDSAAEEAYPADNDATEPEEIVPETAELALITPAQGADLEAGTNTFSGSGEPDSIVRIMADGSELGQTTVDANGNWHLEVNLEAGEPVIEVQAVDAEGNVVGSTTPLAVSVAEVKPVITEPELVLNEMDLYSGSVELSGSGEPGHQVKIFVNGDEAGTVEVGEDDTWNFPLDVEAGESMISLQTLDENGEILNESGPFEIVVQEAIPPSVALPDDDVFAGGMTLSGTGQPGTQVQLYANELAVGVVGVDAEGNYTIELNLTAGKYNIDVATLDKSGKALEIVPALSLPVLALANPEFFFADRDLPEYDPLSGLNVWRGTADPGALLALVIDGEIFAETVADGDGNWKLLTDLDPGTYEVALEQLDLGGNVVNVSDLFNIELDREPPILELPDYSLAAGGEPEDALEQSIHLTAGVFDWAGRSRPSDTLAIIVDDEIIGLATTDINGNWVITTDLESGDHKVQIATIERDGTISNRSAAKDLVVADMNLPTMGAPQLDDTGKGTISGTADPEAIITVTANGKIAGITTTDQNGDWTMNVDLGIGTFELQAQVLNEDGDAIVASSKQTVEISGSVGLVEADDVINVANVQGEFSILLAGLEAAGLTSQLSDTEAAFTLFAPTDEAFDVLPDEVVAAWEENPEAYREIMSYLVLEGAFTQDELVEAQVLTNIAGTNIGITTDDDQVMINGVKIEASIPAGNSIVQAIDQVLLPPLGYKAKPPIIDVSGVSIFTGTYLTVVGTAEPGTTILLQVDGENFGRLARVDGTGSWLTADDISRGVHEIVAYMLGENGLLVAISQPVSLPVQ